jgi:hypothetical protein
MLDIHPLFTPRRSNTYTTFFFFGRKRKKEEKTGKKKSENKRRSPTLRTAGEGSVGLFGRPARGEKVTGKLGMAGSTGESDEERWVGLCGRVFDR